MNRTPRITKNSFAALLALFFLVSAFAAPDRAAVVQRVRAELATILKKEAAKLPIDKPVLELGADELDVVEWVMAVEEAFRVQIPDEKIADKKSEMVRKDFSIASMVTIVMSSLDGSGSKKLTSQTAKAIFHNLHQIAAAADSYYLEQRKTTVSLPELVGPDKFIKRLVVVAGEDYGTLVLQQGTPVVLTYASGETIAADARRSEATTYAFHKVRPGDTAESMAAAAKISVEKLRALNEGVDFSTLEPLRGEAVRIR
jgi:acyl carrier protein